MGHTTSTHTTELVGWARYDCWNSAIAEEFFSGRYGGRPVYLDLEEDALERIRESTDTQGDPSEELVASVVPAIRLGGRGALFGPHAARLRGWRAGSMETPPPVVALLALLSLVAEHMRADHEFRANNYYGRFITVCGGDPRDEHLRAKVIRGFAQHSGELWTGLNRWLETDAETRGIPTAFSFDHRVYVGRPLSQALVRDSDRDALRLLFGEIGLRPGQTVAREDMVRLLRAWLPESHTSRTLRRLASDDDVLVRVAEVACIELQSWTGELNATEHLGGSRLALTATIRRLPRRALNLEAAVVAGPDVEALEAGPRCDEAGRAALGLGELSVRLAQPDPSGWRAATGLRIPDLLISQFEGVAGAAVVRRHARPVVVLARDELSSVFREVSRVRLGPEHLLLAVEGVRPRLERELALVAREGWATRQDLPGLPKGWVAYEGVEIVAISDTRAADLSVLVPIAWTELTLEGGLKLPGRSTWHALAAPELRASAPPGRQLRATLLQEIEDPQPTAAAPTDEVEIEDPQPTTAAPTGEVDAGVDSEDQALSHADGERLIADLGMFEGATVVPLDDLELPPGDYRVRLSDARDDRPLTATSLRLRSADLPLREANVVSLGARGPEEGPMWPVSVSTASDGSEPIPEGDDRPDVEAEIQESDGQARPEATVSAPECYLTGAHYFVLEPAGRQRPAHGARIEGMCRHCGLEKTFPARPTSRFRGNAAGDARVQAPARPRIPPRREEGALDGDLLLDALSSLRHGTAAELLRLFERADSPSLRAVGAMRDLSALGHLEVALDEALRPTHWYVTPTTLVLTDDSCFLMGERSERTMHELGRVAPTSWIEQGSAPARIAIATQHEEVTALAEELRQRLQRDVRVATDPAWHLAEKLPSLWELRGALPRVRSRPIDQSLERFERGSWIAAPSAAADGLYRTTRWPRTFWHQLGPDSRRVDSRLGKWFTTPPTEMMAVDGLGRTVSCPLGAEPPWMYERVLVLASGLTPDISLESRTSNYRDVPPELAHALLGAMTRTDVTENHA